jgi:hypothetical protein
VTFIWFIVWLLSDTPHISFYTWGDWTVALVICLALDIFIIKD